jgi:putative lipoic acid-binding regulatory protein
VTVSFRCDNREQYDSAHAALRADPAIRYTL